MVILDEQTTLNIWIVEYIKCYYPRRSRYELDLKLLDSGYDPADIELAWKFVFFDQHPVAPITFSSYKVPLLISALALSIESIFYLGILGSRQYSIQNTYLFASLGLIVAFILAIFCYSLFRKINEKEAGQLVLVLMVILPVMEFIGVLYLVCHFLY